MLPFLRQLSEFPVLAEFGRCARTLGSRPRLITVGTAKMLKASGAVLATSAQRWIRSPVDLAVGRGRCSQATGFEPSRAGKGRGAVAIGDGRLPKR